MSVNSILNEDGQINQEFVNPISNNFYYANVGRNIASFSGPSPPYSQFPCYNPAGPWSTSLQVPAPLNLPTPVASPGNDSALSQALSFPKLRADFGSNYNNFSVKFNIIFNEFLVAVNPATGSAPMSCVPINICVVLTGPDNLSTYIYKLNSPMQASIPCIANTGATSSNQYYHCHGTVIMEDTIPFPANQYPDLEFTQFQLCLSIPGVNQNIAPGANNVVAWAANPSAVSVLVSVSLSA